MSGPRKVRPYRYQKKLSREDLIEKFPVIAPGQHPNPKFASIDDVFSSFINAVTNKPIQPRVEFSDDQVKTWKPRPLAQAMKARGVDVEHLSEEEISKRFPVVDPGVPTPMDHCFKCVVPEGESCPQVVGCAYRRDEDIDVSGPPLVDANYHDGVGFLPQFVLKDTTTPLSVFQKTHPVPNVNIRTDELWILIFEKYRLLDPQHLIKRRDEINRLFDQMVNNRQVGEISDNVLVRFIGLEEMNGARTLRNIREVNL